EKVGDEGFKKAPIGAGPYKFVSFTPGVELVLEAFDQYWRKAPNVKRLVLKAIPDETTRLAALKRGEVDIGYAIRGPLAERLRRGGLLRRRGDRQRRGARRQLSERGRHPREAPADRAGVVLQGLRGEKISGPHPGRQRRLRQCGDQNRGLHRRGRDVCLR